MTGRLNSKRMVWSLSLGLVLVQSAAAQSESSGKSSVSPVSPSAESAGQGDAVPGGRDRSRTTPVQPTLSDTAALETKEFPEAESLPSESSNDQSVLDPSTQGWLDEFLAPPRRRSEQLASVPDIFGDTFSISSIMAVVPAGLGNGIPQFDQTTPLINNVSQVGVSQAGVSQVGLPNGFKKIMANAPLAGGAQRFKIADNNKALPADRVFFVYNHFHNAVDLQSSGGGSASDGPLSVDRYVIGIEKLLFDGTWSVEVRMPFVGQTDFQSPEFSMAGGNIGNLGVLVKHALIQTESFVAAVGLGIDTPTGSDFEASVPLMGTNFEIDNEAVYLSPFVGFFTAPDDRLFLHGFWQLDVAANGNPITVSNPDSGFTTDGELNEQTLMHFDVSAGYWLWREGQIDSVLPRQMKQDLTGIAAVLEVHYTTTLQEADTFVVPDVATFGNSLNHFDVVNLTAGVHTVISNDTSIRVAGIFPLRSAENRFFDSEVVVGVIRQF